MSCVLIFSVLSVIFLVKYEFYKLNLVLKKNQIEAYKSTAVVYYKCLIYRVLCHWSRSEILRRYIVHLLHISYIKNVTRLCQSILQSRCRNRNGSSARSSVFVIYCARFYFTSARDFSYLFWVDFLSCVRRKLAAQTKFEVKRHFTIRAGRITDTRWIKFIFFPYQYLQNFSVSDQNPGVAAHLR